MCQRDAIGALRGILDEFARSVGILDIGHGHTPQGHEAIGVERGNLAKRTLSLKVPKAMKLADALMEKDLREDVRGRNRKHDSWHALHQVGRLPRPFIVSLAMSRVAGGSAGD